MADPGDDRVASAYRVMPGEGPPPAIDAAIQAAARRAVGSRPGGARRWQIPVSIAAVLALAIGLSLNVEREKPVVEDGAPVSPGNAEYPVPQAAPEKEDAKAPAPAPREAPREVKKEAASPPEAKRFAPEPPRAEPSPAASTPAAAPATAPASMPAPSMPAAPAAASGRLPAVAPSPAPAAAGLAAPTAAAGAAASADAVRAAPQAAKRAKAEPARETTIQEKAMSEALETPERRLERIADLRAKGLHDEADRALAEFRRAYPDYRISDEWLRRLERQ